MPVGQWGSKGCWLQSGYCEERTTLFLTFLIKEVWSTSMKTFPFHKGTPTEHLGGSGITLMEAAATVSKVVWERRCTFTCRRALFLHSGLSGCWIVPSKWWPKGRVFWPSCFSLSHCTLSTQVQILKVFPPSKTHSCSCSPGERTLSSSPCSKQWGLIGVGSGPIYWSRYLFFIPNLFSFPPFPDAFLFWASG